MTRPDEREAFALLGINDRPFMESLAAYMRREKYDKLTFTLQPNGGYEASWTRQEESNAQ